MAGKLPFKGIAAKINHNHGQRSISQKERNLRKACKYGHYVLFLPPYSPDFSPIEQDFATIKKIRSYALPNTKLDDIVKSYGS